MNLLSKCLYFLLLGMLLVFSVYVLVFFITVSIGLALGIGIIFGLIFIYNKFTASVFKRAKDKPRKGAIYGEIERR